MDTFALVCGCDYTPASSEEPIRNHERITDYKKYKNQKDTQIVSDYQNNNDAKKFYNILKDVYKVKPRNIRTLYDNQFTHSNIIKELDNFSKKLNKTNITGIIYIIGHGTSSQRNKDDRRCVIGDEITEILSRTHKDSNLTVISDCTVLDFIKFNDRKWLSIGFLDKQSSDRIQLFKILKENTTITILRLKYLLKKNTERPQKYRSSREIGRCVVNISNEDLYYKNFLDFTEEVFPIICIDDNSVMK